MPDSPIKIGSINLQDFEIPQSVRFGGHHRLTVHSLAGGRRIIERLGPDDNDIRFQGTFSGQNAEARARALDHLRLSGEIVWLTWESFKRQVIVRSFAGDYHSPWWIPYTVSCVVVNQTWAAPSQAINLAAALSADLGRALSAAAGSAFALTSLQAALVATNVLTRSTLDQTKAVAAVSSTLRVINSQMDQQEALLITPNPPGNGPATLSQSYASKVDNAGSLAAAVAVRSYVGRIGMNLTELGV